MLAKSVFAPWQIDVRFIFIFMVAINAAYLLYATLIRVNEPASPVETAFAEGVRPVVLLAERQGDAGRDQQLNEVINNPVLDQTSARTDCGAVGPFPDLFTGQAVVDQLLALDVGAELRAVDRPTGQNDYRVMLPPAKSLQDAFRKLRELQSRNIDGYVITQGREALAISLGVFSIRDSAEKIRLQRTREGYEPVVIEIPQIEREFWLFGATGGDLELNEAVWQRLLAQHKDLQRKPTTCPGPG
jgi:hypothetical protein